MRFRELFEAPISDITFGGDWSRNSSFRDTDRRMLQNPKMIQKITTAWEKTPVDFNMYFINSPEANRYTEIGKVDISWLRRNMPKTFELIDSKYNPVAINVMFTNNKGSEKIPMTPWIIAHRFSHAISRFSWSGHHRDQVWDIREAQKYMNERMSDILKECYGINPSLFKNNSQKYATILKNLYQEIGTMRSARDKNLRQDFEFMHELFAQYLMTGRIKFNPLPTFIRYGHERYFIRCTPIDKEYYNGLLEDLAEQLQDHFLNALTSSIGSIFVM